jgi:hypothetical protein
MPPAPLHMSWAGAAHPVRNPAAMATKSAQDLMVKGIARVGSRKVYGWPSLGIRARSENAFCGQRHKRFACRHDPGTRDEALRTQLGGGDRDTDTGGRCLYPEDSKGSPAWSSVFGTGCGRRRYECKRSLVGTACEAFPRKPARFSLMYKGPRDSSRLSSACRLPLSLVTSGYKSDSWHYCD